MGLATEGVAPFLANLMPKAIKPAPEVEVYARALGKFSLTCPNCGTDQPHQSFPWRQQHFECFNCHARFRLGLGFEYSKGYPAYLMGKYNNHTANRWTPKGNGYDGARLSGIVEWQCRPCNFAWSQTLDESSLECPRCGRVVFVSILVYRASQAPKITVPYDSIVKNVYDAEIFQPVDSAQNGKGNGTASHSLGGNS